MEKQGASWRLGSRVALCYLAGLAVLAGFIHIELPKYWSLLYLFAVIFFFDAISFCFFQSWIRERPCAWQRRIFYALYFAPFLLLIGFLFGLTIENISLWPPFWRTYTIGLVVLLLLPHLIMALMYILWAVIGGTLRWFRASAWAVWCYKWRHLVGVGAAGLSLVVMIYGAIFGAFDLQVLQIDLREGNEDVVMAVGSGAACHGVSDGSRAATAAACDDDMACNEAATQAAAVRASTKRIPKDFSGYKIAQISDFHIGSLVGQGFVKKVVEEILALKPDLIVFTGDMVNFGTAELLSHVPILSRLKAKDGVFAVIGNHDYGDYVSWKSPEEKADNFKKLKETYAQMGWKLLNNSSLWIKRGRDSLRLVGVENWGSSHRFPKRGDLKAALKQTACAMDTAVQNHTFRKENYPHLYTVLLSHDPSHFDSIVAPFYPQVDLCLSGHTHGMQLGVRFKNRDYTGAHLFYEKAAGLYALLDGRRLYVNTGVGFNGSPFRLGIRPRIVLFKL